ncbi:MAG: hypothetical protein JRF20_08865 [Deltaproteobacteria bacterium]|nr:hypothetical protein [Deltaproteobacteria bacterium]MBW1933277.1 hypothetical protein [Deltaproteobacteria bacterium]MBW1965298.1 hypothetical protein [Deltaproteobacteria bacterium]MBW2081341.1 hypothetical protein [Deltaproteobacteria bacterium]MBW2351282.1 hypothetical protein [Deltaproteobacteria bacterium]
MKKRLVFLSVFVIAFLVGSQGVILAQGKKVSVSGHATFAGPPLLTTPPPVTTDDEGNTHYLGMRLKGDFYLTDGRTWEFKGTRFAEIWGIQFNKLRIGHRQGPITVYTSEMEEVAWVGQFHVSCMGTAASHLASGEMILEGVGDYEGMQLELDAEQKTTDSGEPKYFVLEGQLRVIPPGLRCRPPWSN